VSIRAVREDSQVIHFDSRPDDQEVDKVSQAAVLARGSLRLRFPREFENMGADRHIYGEINSRTGMKRVFSGIRRDVATAGSRPALTELYKRAGYLIALTRAPSWQRKFGREAPTLQAVGKEEFRKTARKINVRAAQIGTDADYDDQWGDGS
jgi:hypothetical protein